MLYDVNREIQRSVVLTSNGGYRGRQDVAPDQQVSVVIAGSAVGRIAVADVRP
jgi:hypothetical protein